VSDGSGFFVGPATAPDALELVALLGAGGEGEVWRALVRTPGVAGAVGDDIAIKITRHDLTDGTWPDFARLLTSLAHPGLVRVRAAFSGAERHRAGAAAGESHRYVVMDHEPGPTLRQWSAEHPDASLTERAHLLRQVAAALDALHAGAGADEPVAHGDVKPGNVIVRPNGSTVVVDLGLARLTSGAGTSGNTAAYTAPELRRSGALATTEGDAFAFAVTAAEVLTGQAPPVDSGGHLDVSALGRHLRVNAVTRRHAALIRQLNKALTAPAEARPRLLRPWLDEALEPQRQTITAAEQVVAPEIDPAAAPKRRNAWLVAVLAVLLLATAATAVYLGVARSDDGRASAPPDHATKLLDYRDLTWPLADPCDESTAVAMVSGGKPITMYEGRADPRTAIAEQGGGSWRDGHLRFTLISNSSDVIWVTELAATRVGEYDLTPPAWVYRTVHSGCTPHPPGDDRRYLYRAGGALTEPPSTTPGRIERFALRPHGTARIDIDVRSCVANARWRLSVTYFVAGHAPRTLAIRGMYRSFGYAQNTPVHGGTMRPQGVHISDLPAVSGSDPGCADAP
jgi:serine/threonine protein kinase